MPLTIRQNGTTAPSLITASWWNDYYNLLTGAMTDQPITLMTSASNQAISDNPSSAPSAALATGTNLGTGAYQYVVTFYGTVGETASSPTVSITTTSGNQKVSLTTIPTGPTGTTGRKVYRTLVGGSVYHLLTTIADNTTTAYTDTTADATISSAASPPTANHFGGYFEVKNQAGTAKAGIYGDGTFFASTLVGTMTRYGYPNDTFGFGLNGSGDSGFMLGTGSSALILGSANQEWFKINNYFDNTNDRYWTANAAMQINITNSVIQMRQSTGTPTAGGVVTWGSWRPLVPVFTGTSTPSGAQEGDVWIKA